MSEKGARGQSFVKRMYAPRIVGLGLGFFCVASVYFQKEAHPLAWLGLIANGFLWPHLAYLIARTSRNPYKAEIRNLLIDSFLGGMWVPLMSFNLLPSATVIFMLSMDNISVGGVRLFAKGASAQLMGGFLAILFFGLNIRIESTMLNVLACIPMLAVFPLSIGIITYRLARKLSEQKKEIENINIAVKDSNVNLTAAYEAMRESEKRYRTLYESSRDGIMETDMEGRFVDFNRSYLDMLGYTSDELMGRSYKEITPPQWEKDEDRIVSEQIIGRGYSDVYEKEYLRKDGTIIPVEMRAYLLKDNGRNVRMWGIARDITDRKRLEAALREESEEKYRVLMENAGEAIFVTQEGMLKSVNAKTEELIGYTKEELASRPFLTFIHPDDRAPALDRYFKGPQGREIPSRSSFRVVHRSGETLWTELNAVLIEWDGKPAALNFLSDITDLKRKEEEKRILEERLQHAAKMEAVGTLAGGIAHDFNNLLMGIEGEVSLMLFDLDPSHPNYEKLKRIEEQVDTGASLTKQLLGFSRRGRYEVKPTNINEIIDKTSVMFGRTKKEIAVGRRLAGDLWAADVDRGQMEQVFMNLYVNAWQAMPKGGEIVLETENIVLDDAQAMHYAVQSGRYVKITITDTGTGMDEETKKRIFDPFFTTKSMGRGTGLGLATVYGIIKGHKGAIDVNSVLGRGTTFNIYLPASESTVAKEQAIHESIIKGTGTILIADDEELVLKVSTKMLETLGYRVYTAKSGQEAIAVYMEKRNEINLVILDMIMPGLLGGETFDRLREINPGIKVLLASGYSVEGQAQEILDRGCNGFIQKPFRLEKISQKVREMF